MAKRSLASYLNNPGPKQTVAGCVAACSTDNAIVTETILKVLKEGGNAADAGIAGCLVQAAAEPFMTNHTGTVTFLCYEAGAGKLHQLESSGTFPDGMAPFRPVPSQGGGYALHPPAACIPGFMPGIKAIHERFGTLGWPRLCEDAIRWAEEGHPVSTFEYGVNIWSQDFITYFPSGRAFYMPEGHFVPVGERFGSAAMAETLRGVAKEGPDYMIEGRWADDFIAVANGMGWKIRKKHMTETPPVWVEPVRFAHHEWEVVSLGPPQLQGVFCAIVLGVLKHLGARRMQPGAAEHLYAMAHALRQGQRHYEFSNDPAHQGVPLDVLLDDGYHRSLARLIAGSKVKTDLSKHARLTKTAPPPGFGFVHPGKPTGGSARPEQPPGSCELAIVDKHGNWVQMMNTLQSGGIPGMVVGGVPMVGSHASFGWNQSPIDAKIKKGFRLRSTIGNTMVLKDGRPVFSLGSPGNIAFTMPQVLTYLLDFGMDPYAAVEAPRMAPLDETNTIVMEDRVSELAQKKLARWGMGLMVTPAYDFHMGSFQLCFRDERTGKLGATADPRRMGVAGGLRR